VSNEPAIRCDGVDKTFVVPHGGYATTLKHGVRLRRRPPDVLHALSDVSFSIDEGEFFGIVGPNGGGKSTLLNVIAGIYRADGGDVRVRGQVSAFINLGVGFHPELTARENVFVNAGLLGLSRKQVASLLDEILEFAELERYADQQLRNFSSGMTVRLAYSVSIRVPFDVLLLDEVLAVGDRAFQKKCIETFKEIKKSGRTVVLVSHNLSAINAYCDRALYLNNGRVGAIGPPKEVIGAYVGQTDTGLSQQMFPPGVTFGEGWHPVEYDVEAQPFRWMGSNAQITIEPRDGAQTLVMDLMSFFQPRRLIVRSEGKQLVDTIVAPDSLEEVEIRLPADGRPLVLELEADPRAERASIVNPADRRMLSVSIWNVRMEGTRPGELAPEEESTLWN
jgi:ABC-type polysaccharide/polyol phosphate transport system ATPase subunit